MQLRWVGAGGIIRLLSALVLLGLLAGPTAMPAAAGDPISEAKRLLARVTRRREASRQRLQQLEQQERSAVASLQQVERELYETISRLQAAETELQKIEVHTRDLERQQEENKATMIARAAAYGARLRVMYKLIRTSPLELILGADDFQDALKRLSLVSAVAREDSRLAAAVQREQEASEDIRRQLDEALAKAEVLRATIDTERQRLSRQQARQRQLITQIQVEERRTRAQMTDWDRQAQALSSRIRQLVAAERRRLEELARRRREAERRRALPGAGGPFMWPVSGPITAVFGQRTFAQRFHTGIDIAAPMRTPIRAARGGIVVYAGYAVPGNRSASYGMMVIVAHDIEFQTLYAHMDDRRSPPRVKRGQEIRQGTILGVIGMTGITSGPHLHFEVRQNGVPRNPMTYLRR